jgi:hypothetical protein
MERDEHEAHEDAGDKNSYPPNQAHWSP